MEAHGWFSQGVGGMEGRRGDDEDGDFHGTMQTNVSVARGLGSAVIIPYRFGGSAVGAVGGCGGGLVE